MFINNYLNLVIKKKNYHNSQISYLDPKKNYHVNLARILHGSFDQFTYNFLLTSSVSNIQNLNL